jgi:hypothetical protein
MARTTTDDPIIEQLKKLAQAEATAAKERLAKRTAAARDFGAAAATRAEAQATWERIQGEVDAKQAKAVASLLDTDLKAAQVAELLGIEVKDVRMLRAVAPEGAAGGSPAGRAVESEEGGVSGAAAESHTTAA